MHSRRYHAVFYEAFEEEQEFLRKFLPEGARALFTWKTIQESGHKLPPAPIISIRTQSRIPPEWRICLAGIITRSTGYDHITGYLNELGSAIPSAYLPEYAARAVAEHALMLWTALLRNLERQRESFKAFHRDGLTGREVCGRRITVVGVGRIGGQVVDIAHGLHMDVKGVDIVPRKEMKEDYGLDYLPLDKGLARAEILVSALPLTELTRGMLGYKKLMKMPKGGIFISVGRGEVSPSQDLLRLLKEKRLAGVGLDVYDCEKELAAVLRDGKKPAQLPASSRKSVAATLNLMKHPNVILTPHNAFNTRESVERKCRETMLNLEAYLKTGKFLTPVPCNLL